MSEPKFDFSKLALGARTSRMILYQIEGQPYLDLAFAGETNKPYYNALIKRSRKNVRRVRAGAIDGSMIKENRNEDRALYPKHVIKGWGCAAGEGFTVDSTGKQFSFSEANVAAFLQALPDWLFDEVRAYATEESNFVEEDSDEEVPDPEAVSGN